MSCVCILTPVVIMAWPAFSAAVTAAAASLGYQMAVDGQGRDARGTLPGETNMVQMELSRSQVVPGKLGRAACISVTRVGVSVTLSRDSRGHVALCVAGTGHSEEALRAMGEELGQCVVQQYVYRKLMDEMHLRGFNVMEEEVGEDRSIRLKVRYWEN